MKTYIVGVGDNLVLVLDDEREPKSGLKVERQWCEKGETGPASQNNRMRMRHEVRACCTKVNYRLSQTSLFLDLGITARSRSRGAREIRPIELEVRFSVGLVAEIWNLSENDVGFLLSDSLLGSVALVSK